MNPNDIAPGFTPRELDDDFDVPEWLDGGAAPAAIARAIRGNIELDTRFEQLMNLDDYREDRLREREEARRAASRPRLKAAPTFYAGIWFRSRAEARWAMVFDALALQWQYEVEGFNLPTRWYEPDFWLPGLSAFAEVKGGSWQFDEVAQVKACELVTHSRRPILICTEITPALELRAFVPDATLPCGYAEYHCSLMESVLRGRLWLDRESQEWWGRLLTGKLLERIEAIRNHRFFNPSKGNS